MTDYNFIRYKRTLSDALSQDESAEVTQNYIGAIQLKPNDPEPYFQLSKFDESINLGDYSVFVVKIANCDETDITNNVTITTFVEDGITQAKFQYSDIPIDFGTGLVYLRVDLHGSLELPGVKIIYSNLFLITDNEIDKTTRLDYIDNTRLGNENFKQSIRLAMYAHNHVANTEIDSYYQISTEQNVNSRIQENSLQEYYMPPINAWTFKRIEKAFYNGGFWLDLVRSYLTAPIEYVERQELSNVSEQIFTTDPNEDDILNIVNVEIQRNTIPMLSSTTVRSSTSQLSSEIVTYGDDADAFTFRVEKDGGTAEATECIDDPILTPFLYQASGFKAGKTYSPAPTDGLGDFAVVRASVQTRINEGGNRESLANNVPSIDFINGECPILNNPEQQTNVIEYSKDLSNSWWTKNISTVNDDGTLILGRQAFKWIPDSGVAQHSLRRSDVIANDSNTYIRFITVKKAEARYIVLSSQTFFNSLNRVIFDMQDKVFTQVGGSVAGMGYLEHQNGELTVWIISINDSPDRNDFAVGLSDNGTTPNFTGDGVKGVYITDINMLEGTKLEPCIDTSGSTATRLETVCTTTVIAGVSEVIETIGGVEQAPQVVVPGATYTMPNGEINKITMT